MGMKLTAIILAGGKSSRMGTDKGLVLFNGKPMIEYLIAIFKSLDIPIIIIANNPIYNQFNVPVFEDLIKEKGPLSGIYTGLSNVETEKNIVISCDVPCVSNEMIEILIQSSKNEKITIVSYKNKIHPLIGIYSKELIDKLLSNLLSEKLKVRDLIDSVDSKIIELDELNLINIEKQLTNINTKVELKLIEDGI